MNSTPVKKPEPPKKPDFEKSLARLEEVVRGWKVRSFLSTTP